MGYFFVLAWSFAIGFSSHGNMSRSHGKATLRTSLVKLWNVPTSFAWNCINN